MTEQHTSLESLEKLIRDDLSQYAKLNRTSVARFQENEHADNVLLDALENCIDVTPALLTVIGYRMAGGDNDAIIVPMARAVLMLHIYAQDLSASPDLSVMSGMHAAQIIIGKSGIDAEQRLQILSQLNRTLLLYAQAKAHREQYRDKVQVCYATELFVTPLHVGLLTARAPQAFIDSILPFAVAAGRTRIASAEDATRYRERAYELLAQATHPIRPELHQQLLLLVE